MAADFWVSSHCRHWLLDRETLSRRHLQDTAPGNLALSPDEIRAAKTHYARKFIFELAKIRYLPQRVVGTAMIFFQRFYANGRNITEGPWRTLDRRRCVSLADPRLVAPTCLYVAVKVEEYQQQVFAAAWESEIQKIDSQWPFTDREILECEFIVVEELRFQLIVFQTHSYGTELMNAAGLAERQQQDVLSILNDSYFSDAWLLCPPHIVLLACIFVYSAEDVIPADVPAGGVGSAKLAEWFAELDVDVASLWAAVDEILGFYRLMQEFDDDLCRRRAAVLAQRLAEMKPAARAVAGL